MRGSVQYTSRESQPMPWVVALTRSMTDCDHGQCRILPCELHAVPARDLTVQASVDYK